jgi:dTDP-4-dehydrorhamnose reductase
MSIRRSYPGDILISMSDGIENIAVIGGGGLLSTELKKVSPNIQLFKKEKVDITDTSTFRHLDVYDTIIHTAALIDNTDIKNNEVDYITTNIIGTANLTNYCLMTNKRLVYISTDYVYDGSGDHKEDDPVNPYNLYSWSKLGGECSVRFLENHVIIRTSFGKTEFPYPKGFNNLYSSKDYVDIIAPIIMKVVNNKDFRGTINVGTERKSLYQYALTRNEGVEPTSLPETKDFSMDLTKLKNI